MHPKAVPVQLDGQTKHLVYDINALCRLRDIGCDAFKLDEAALGDPRTVRALVWAGLLEECPDVTLEQVGSWIDLANLPAVAHAFTKGFERSTQTELGDPQ